MRKPIVVVLGGAWMAVPAAIQAPAPAPASEPAFNRSLPFDIMVEKTDLRTGVTVQDVSYAQLDGARNRAHLVRPTAKGPHAAIPFVHWLGEPSARPRRVGGNRIAQ